MRPSIFLILFLSLALAGCAAPNTQVPAGSQTAAFPPEASTPTPGLTAAATQIRGCSVAEPAPTPALANLYPPITEADYSVGPEDGAVTLIEYCDFQAPICRSMAAVVSNVLYNNPEQVRFIFRPVPMVGRLDKSELAVQAAIAAGDQGKFWEMYDLLFQKNAEWDPMTPAQFEEWLKDQAAQIGLNAGEFAADLKSEATRSRSQAMYDTARSFNLQSVPLLLINGQAQPAFALDQASIESSVSLIALGQRQFTDCPAFTIDPGRDYIATLHTERGDIVIQLFPDKAPLAVNSFVFLARSGWFDNTTFHRVISGFMAQAGDPTGTGRGNPGYFFDDEIHPTLRFDKPGVVAMANQGPDTNGSQFFITYAAAPHLDGVHTIFGQVFSGMDVLAKLTPRDPQQAPSGPSGDRLLSVEIEEK